MFLQVKKNNKLRTMVYRNLHLVSQFSAIASLLEGFFTVVRLQVCVELFVRVALTGGGRQMYTSGMVYFFFFWSAKM